MAVAQLFTFKENINNRFLEEITKKQIKTTAKSAKHTMYKTITLPDNLVLLLIMMTKTD